MKEKRDEIQRIQEEARREEYLKKNLGPTQEEIRKGKDEKDSRGNEGGERAKGGSDQEDYEREAEYAESDRREWGRQNEIGRPTHLRRIRYNDSEDSDDAEKGEEEENNTKNKNNRGKKSGKG